MNNKSKAIATITTLLITSIVLGGCQKKEKNENLQETTTSTVEITTEPTSEITEITQATETTTEHVHNYSEAVTTEATCEKEGVRIFACECGDSYMEVIEALGHSFSEYVYNNDATYIADGTETAACFCGETDTRTVSGTKLEYTYNNLEKIMYVNANVNVLDLPSTDGKEIGTLGKLLAVEVTGQCNETKWYRIKYSDSVGYVSDNYLTIEKPVFEDFTFTDCYTSNIYVYTITETNVWDLPSIAGEKVGQLEKGEEIFVTGICNETGWYRFDYHLKFIGKYVPRYIPADCVEVRTAESVATN